MISDKGMYTNILHEKGSGLLNEDAVLLKGNLAGVFDGATSLHPATYGGGKTGGYYASAIAGKIFRKNDGDLADLADRANKAISRHMVAFGVDISRKEHLWSTSAAVVRIQDGYFEWVQTGDSLIIVIYEDGSYRMPVPLTSHDRETLTLWKEMSENASESIFESLKEQIVKVRGEMNRSYGVLNGEASYSDFLRTGQESLSGVRDILLFTDGLFIPSENPAEKENFDGFVDLYMKGGLDSIRDYVRTLEENDPHCRKYPRFKKHDDIAAVSICVSREGEVLSGASSH